MLFTSLGRYWEKLCPLSPVQFFSIRTSQRVNNTYFLWAVNSLGMIDILLFIEGHLEWFLGSQFLILEEQELHYIFVKKSIFLPRLNIFVWTYKIKFNNLASLWAYFLSRSISFEEWNFFLPPVCIALAIPPLSFLSNGFLYHFSTFWIHQKNVVKTWGK